MSTKTKYTFLQQECREDEETINSIISTRYASKGQMSKRKKKLMKREIRRRKYELLGAYTDPTDISKNNKTRKQAATTLFVYGVTIATILL